MAKCTYKLGVALSPRVEAALKYLDEVKATGARLPDELKADLQARLDQVLTEGVVRQRTPAPGESDSLKYEVDFPGLDAFVRRLHRAVLRAAS
jgi:hypothetical protein